MPIVISPGECVVCHGHDEKLALEFLMGNYAVLCCSDHAGTVRDAAVLLVREAEPDPERPLHMIEGVFRGDGGELHRKRIEEVLASHPISREQAVECLARQPDGLRASGKRWCRLAELIEVLLAGGPALDLPGVREEIERAATGECWSDVAVGRAMRVMLRCTAPSLPNE